MFSGGTLPVTRITERQTLIEVTAKVGTLEFVGAITEGSVKNMGLKVNDSVMVASNVVAYRVAVEIRIRSSTNPERALCGLY